jgi:hypothetical protein
VSAIIDGQTISATTNNITILGTNPTTASVNSLIAEQQPPPNWPTGTQYNYDNVLEQIEANEGGVSGGYDLQFLSNGDPRFNIPRGNVGPGDGGAGLMQISPPNIEDVWDWKTNLIDGVATFDRKLTAAVDIFNEIPDLLSANAQSTIASLGLSSISFGITPDMIVRDAVERYNGGVDYGAILNPNGTLEVSINPTTKIGTVLWRERGGYVNAVLGPD